MMEYRLKNSQIDFSHNVMHINAGSNFKLSDLAPPVRMYRDSQRIEGGTNAPQRSTTNQHSSSFKGMEKRKIQIIETSLSDDEDQRIREEEKAPWILEDSEDRVFSGRLEGGQSSNYVLLVNQGNNFHVVPVAKWYRFNPKIQYRTLSLEDAEKTMALSSKRASEARWLMKTATAGSSMPISERAGEQSSAASKPKLKIASGNVSHSDSNYYAQNLESTDLDYDVEGMFFQDDDEAAIDGNLDEEASEEAKGRKSSSSNPASHSQRITKWGKELKKIMKHTNDPNLHLYFNGLEEVKDPYAASDAEEEEEDSLPESPNPSRLKRSASSCSLNSASASASQPSSPLIGGAGTGEIGFASGVGTFSQQEPSSSGMQTSSIDEDAVIGFLKRGPSTAKALIEHFKVQIRINPRNREVIPSILKKVALIKKSEEGGEKVLELREEYRKLSQF